MLRVAAKKTKKNHQSLDNEESMISKDEQDTNVNDNQVEKLEKELFGVIDEQFLKPHQLSGKALEWSDSSFLNFDLRS